MKKKTKESERKEIHSYTHTHTHHQIRNVQRAARHTPSRTLQGHTGKDKRQKEGDGFTVSGETMESAVSCSVSPSRGS